MLLAASCAELYKKEATVYAPLLSPVSGCVSVLVCFSVCKGVCSQAGDSATVHSALLLPMSSVCMAGQGVLLEQTWQWHMCRRWLARARQSIASLIIRTA